MNEVDLNFYYFHLNPHRFLPISVQPYCEYDPLKYSTYSKSTKFVSLRLATMKVFINQIYCKYTLRQKLLEKVSYDLYLLSNVQHVMSSTKMKVILTLHQVVIRESLSLY